MEKCISPLVESATDRSKFSCVAVELNVDSGYHKREAEAFMSVISMQLLRFNHSTFFSQRISLFFTDFEAVKRLLNGRFLFSRSKSSILSNDPWYLLVVLIGDHIL